MSLISCISAKKKDNHSEEMWRKSEAALRKKDVL